MSTPRLDELLTRLAAAHDWTAEVRDSFRNHQNADEDACLEASEDLGSIRELTAIIKQISDGVPIANAVLNGVRLAVKESEDVAADS